MRIDDAPVSASLADVFARVVERGVQVEREEHVSVASEHLLTVRADGAILAERSVTPEHLGPFVAGMLLSEGHVAGPGDIERISFSDDGTEAHVTGRIASRPIVPSARDHVVPVRREDAFALADAMAEDLPLHRRTRAAHGALLMCGGEILSRCEDIGRHNALDKAIGWAMSHDVELEGALLCTTGRAPVDMVRKAVRAGVAGLVCKGAPTVEGARLAEEMRLTLIGRARPDRFEVWAGRAV